MSSLIRLLFWIYLLGVVFNLLVVVVEWVNQIKQLGIKQKIELEFKKIVNFVLLSWVSYILILNNKYNR